jgi:hypothetical protein
MLFSLFAQRTTRRPITPKAPPRFRPQLDGFEDRVVPAAPVDLAPAQAAAPALASQVIPITIDAVNLVNGALQAVGHIGSTQFTVPLNLSASPNAQNPDCPILDLHLNAIHLNLLGLNVDTSNICLSVTAQHGQGLLGDLLCDVSNALNGGLNLGDILGGLTNWPFAEPVVDPGSGQLLGVVTRTSALNVLSSSPSASGGDAGDAAVDAGIEGAATAGIPGVTPESTETREVAA